MDPKVKNLYYLKVFRTVDSKGNPTTSVIRQSPFWKNGSTVNVAFLDGELAQQNVAKQAFLAYADYANLDFKFIKKDAAAAADVRATFKSDDKTSALGQHALLIEGSDTPTLYLGDISSTPEDSDLKTAFSQVGLVLGLQDGFDIGLKQDQEATMQKIEEASNANEWAVLPPQYSVLDKCLSQFNTSEDATILASSDKANELPDETKAFLSLIYPGRNAVSNGVTWNLLHALDILQVDSTKASALLKAHQRGGAPVLRDAFTFFYDSSPDLASSDHEDVAAALKATTQPSENIQKLISTADEGPQQSSQNDETFNDIFAACVMHPHFLPLVERLARGDLKKNHGVKSFPTPEPEVQSGIWGTVIGTVGNILGGLLSSGIPVQPMDAQSGLFNRSGPPPFISPPIHLPGVLAPPAGLYAPLPPEIQQGIFDSIVKALGNPAVINVVKTVAGVAGAIL